MTDGNLLRAEDVAAQLKVKTNTVYQWAKRGLISCNRLGRCVRFTEEDIREFIKDGRREAKR